ncbi:MAG TPA: MauE/DoxX family redox-associated membrane protein [Balneolaceae bacterium]|nr:MauE/DoxX family redox-associated membrane protein [Balneolaceae bacterium]
MNPKYSRIALTTIRIILGLLFLVSGIGKLINASDARYLVELLATEFYWLIEYSTFIVTAASVVELILAVFLLWGKYLKSALAGSLVLILIFTSVLSYFYFQGMEIASCGCFGAFGGGGGLGFTLIRNLTLIALIIGAYLLLPSSNKDSEAELALGSEL